MQRAVAQHPDLLRPPGMASLDWRSPLAEDDHAEYRDASFLDRLGLGAHREALAAFWPTRGPQWDGLALGPDGAVILAEAKAHVREFLSPPSAASEKSRGKIDAAFAAVRGDLDVTTRTDWCEVFYQYANRLAHLWFLRREGVDAHLLLVGFLGDADMGGPRTAEAWRAAYLCADHALGLRHGHALRPFIHHVYPEVATLT